MSSVIGLLTFNWIWNQNQIIHPSHHLLEKWHGKAEQFRESDIIPTCYQSKPQRKGLICRAKKSDFRNLVLVPNPIECRQTNH